MRSQIDLLKEAGLFGGDGLFAGLFGGGQDGGQSSGWARLFDSDMLLPIGMALLGAGGAQPYGQSRLGAGGQALMQGMQFVDRRRDRAERKKYRDLLTRREESDLEATEAKRGRADRARSQMLGWYHPDEQRYTGGGLID